MINGNRSFEDVPNRRILSLEAHQNVGVCFSNVCRKRVQQMNLRFKANHWTVTITQFSSAFLCKDNTGVCPRDSSVMCSQHTYCQDWITDRIRQLLGVAWGEDLGINVDGKMSSLVRMCYVTHSVPAQATVQLEINATSEVLTSIDMIVKFWWRWGDSESEAGLFGSTFGVSVNVDFREPLGFFVAAVSDLTGSWSCVE